MRRVKKKTWTVVPWNSRNLIFSLFAIDPGTSTVGWSYITLSIENGILRNWLVTNGSIKTKGILPMRLFEIAREIKKILIYTYDVGIIEMPFVNKNWNTAIILSYSRGILISKLYPMTVKQYDFPSTKTKYFFNGLIKEEASEIISLELGLRFKNVDEADAFSMNLIFICSNLLEKRRFLDACQNLRETSIN